jgi:DNA gyrase/topoisomerase IV subunit B
MEAKEGEVNAAIYHQSRSKNWKKIQDVPNGLGKMKATAMMKAAKTMNLKAKHLKQVTIRSIKITKTPKLYALRSRPY